jgi:hypothetical protein
MLLAVPYHALEIGRVHIDPFRPDRKGRPLAPLTYRDTYINTLDLTLITPALTLVEYDTARNRLVLDTSAFPLFQAKFATLQDYIVNLMHLEGNSFFGKTMGLEQLRTRLQPLFVGQHLIVYSYPNLLVQLKGDTVCNLSEVKSGMKLSLALRIHGILEFQGRSGAQLRIQHSVAKIREQD